MLDIDCPRTLDQLTVHLKGSIKITKRPRPANIRLPADLGAQFGIDRRPVSNILYRNGVQMRQRGLTPDEVDDAIHLYNLGWSLARVGNHLNVDHTTVLARLRHPDPRHPRTTTGKMTRHVPAAGSYAPVTLLVEELADHRTRVYYDEVASAIAPYDNRPHRRSWRNSTARS